VGAAPAWALTLKDELARPVTDGGCLRGATLRSVMDFGAKADGLADDSRAAQSAYDSLVATGGTLFFPAGRYRIALKMHSRNIHVRGEGRGATILLPARPDDAVLNAVYREGSWDGVTIADLTVEGIAPTRGIGFMTGTDPRQKHDEYSGSTFLSRIQFRNLDTCIYGRSGSIGLWIDGCQFGSANFHIWTAGVERSAGADAMHGGCIIVSRSYMAGFAKAMFFIDSAVSGAGQIVFENNIFEMAPGFVAYIRRSNTRGGIPGISFRNNWNEATATGANIEIAGTVHPKARFLFARSAVAPIRFDDTPIGDLELVESSVETRNCDLQNLTTITADANSTVRHANARLFEGTCRGRVLSIAAPINTDGLRTPWFPMSAPQGRTARYRPAVILREPAAAPIAFMGGALQKQISTTAQAAGLFDVADAAQDFDLSASPPLFPARHAELARPGWLVTLYVYRLLSGKGVRISLNGSSGLTGTGELVSSRWEMLVNISRNLNRTAQRISIYHQSAGPARVRTGGYAILSFDTLDEALECANSGLFPL
jgi:hypothetical protein